MDSLQISHKDQKIVDNILKIIERKHGRMSVTRGKKYTYVGMIIEYYNNGSVELSMKYYILEATKQFPEDITSSQSTPAAFYLLDVDKDSVVKILKHSTRLQLSYCLFVQEDDLI